MGKRWGRVVQTAAGILICALVIRHLAGNWSELASTKVEWSIGPFWLLAAAGITWSAYGVLIVTWQRVLRGWSAEIPVLRAARIWAVSSLGRYVPGKIWTIIGMSLLAREEGVPATVAAASAVLLQLLSLGTGAAVVAVTAQGDLRHFGAAVQIGLGVLGAIALGAALVLLHRQWAQRILSTIARQPDVPPPRPSYVLLGIVANAVVWVAYGVAFWCLVRGVLPATTLSVGESIGVFCASYIVGFIAPFAPGGLGVRESMFIVMLQGKVGLSSAVALAVASRVFLTVVELGFVIPFLFMKSEKRRGAPTTS